MTQPIVLEGVPAWLKRYEAGHRRLRLALLGRVASWFALWPLRPPPHPGGEGARQVEARRIRQLQSLGVRVPRILGESDDALVLSDIGETLSSQMRACGEDVARLDALTTTAAVAIAAAHRRGAYLGQPWPRNLTLHQGEVGFLDFEEDPLEVMSLAQAQGRDWLLFVFGAARFYRDRPDALTRIVQSAIRDVPQDAVASAGAVGARLQPLARLLAGFGRSARTLSNAILVVRSATVPLLLAVVLCLGLDWLGDGDLDLLLLLI